MTVEIKTKVRKEIKERLSKQNKAQRLRKSSLITRKLIKLSEFKKATFVMFYIASSEEVETALAIEYAQKVGKKIVLPTVLVREKRMIASLVKDLRRELSPGPFEIPQPKKKYIREVPYESIDLVIVPGLAFDRQGNRLGRGAGYYDKFLAMLPKETPRIGLAFDFQVLKDLPTLSHDISVDKVISA